MWDRHLVTRGCDQWRKWVHKRSCWTSLCKCYSLSTHRLRHRIPFQPGHSSCCTTRHSCLVSHCQVQNGFPDHLSLLSSCWPVHQLSFWPWQPMASRPGQACRVRQRCMCSTSAAQARKGSLDALFYIMPWTAPGAQRPNGHVDQVVPTG